VCEELGQQFRGARSFKSKSLARELWNKNMNIHIGSIRFARRLARVFKVG